MPTYQYACTECGERTEAVQSFTDAPLTECVACGGRLRKVFSAVGVVFKGSGFYKNDSRAAAGKGSEGKGSESGEGGDKAAADKGGDKADKAVKAGSGDRTGGGEGAGSSGKADKGGGGSGDKSAAPAATAPKTPVAKSA